MKKAQMPTPLPPPAAVSSNPPLVVCLRSFFCLGSRFRAGAERVGHRTQLRERLVQELAAVEPVMTAVGFTPTYNLAARFAVVAFLDESILNSSDRALWADHTLEQELWKQRVGGQAFFDKLQALEKDGDSPELCELLEVYCLCILLGFKGKYFGASENQIPAVIARLEKRIQRMRRVDQALAPEGSLPTDEPLSEPTDRWARGLKICAVACTAVALCCYAGALLHLGGIVRKVVGLWV